MPILPVDYLLSSTVCEKVPGPERHPCVLATQNCPGLFLVCLLLFELHVVIFQVTVLLPFSFSLEAKCSLWKAKTGQFLGLSFQYVQTCIFSHTLSFQDVL